MKSLLMMLAVGVLLGTGAAHADPDGGTPDPAAADAGFLAALQAAGITYTYPAQVISAGRTMCALADRGETGLELIADIKAQNPGFSTDGAAVFAAIASRSYCPHHLIHK